MFFLDKQFQFKFITRNSQIQQHLYCQASLDKARFSAGSCTTGPCQLPLRTGRKQSHQNQLKNCQPNHLGRMMVQRISYVSDRRCEIERTICRSSLHHQLQSHPATLQGCLSQFILELYIIHLNHKSRFSVLGLLNF